MANSSAKADDPRRGRQISQGRHQARAWQEPSGGSRASQADAGGRGGAKRRPSDRGIEDRGRQARSPHCHRRGPGRSRWRLGERSVEALTTGPVPVLTQAAGDRPLLRRAYRTFTMRRSGTTESTDAIFILDHPLPLVSSRRIAGRGRAQTKENLSVETLVSAHHARALAKTYAQRISEKPEET